MSKEQQESQKRSRKVGHEVLEYLDYYTGKTTGLTLFDLMQGHAIRIPINHPDIVKLEEGAENIGLHTRDHSGDFVTISLPYIKPSVDRVQDRLSNDAEFITHREKKLLLAAPAATEAQGHLDKMAVVLASQILQHQTAIAALEETANELGISHAVKIRCEQLAAASRERGGPA